MGLLSKRSPLALGIFGRTNLAAHKMQLSHEEIQMHGFGTSLD